MGGTGLHIPQQLANKVAHRPAQQEPNNTRNDFFNSASLKATGARPDEDSFHLTSTNSDSLHILEKPFLTYYSFPPPL